MILVNLLLFVYRTHYCSILNRHNMTISSTQIKIIISRCKMLNNNGYVKYYIVVYNVYILFNNYLARLVYNNLI